MGAAKKQQKFFRSPSVSFADSIPQCGIVASLRSQGSLATLLALLGLLRAASRTARALRAPPLEKGSLLDSGATV